MAATGKKNEPAKKANEKLQEKPEDKSKKKPPADEDDEDGDIATPKRDRYGADDEPL
jgi:hypothetical protein